MRFLYCLIVGILLSLPITAENAVLKKAELRVLDIGNSYTSGATRLLPLIAQKAAYLATQDMYHCQNPEDFDYNGVANDSTIDIIYDLQGRRKYHIEKGVNIIRMSDGNTKKVIKNT